MRRSKMNDFMTTLLISVLLISILLTAGCDMKGSQTGTANNAEAGSASGTSASTTSSTVPPASDKPTDAQQAPEPTQANEPPKNATWVLDINDTQQITYDMGIIWNYTLTFHASKPGGTNVTGEFTGEAQLKIEPDFGSVQSAAAREGTTLLDLVFNYSAECENMTFVVEKFSEAEYSEQMKQVNKDSPLQPIDPGASTDFFAVTGATFNATQEPVAGTIQTDKGPFSAAGGGGGTTISVPTEITVDGATAYVFFYNTPHPLARAFKGTITGDVLPT